ncbi:hypothetical protein O3M35_010560 [Rhynocoris fuscipes]|uniref:CDC20/Fizzy WD40 domain-containing protein n=1 Tax=Rhynocoris fuscipes TaxID=488301 RepID=A0AAW1CZE6_9HEMI
MNTSKNDSSKSFINSSLNSSYLSVSSSNSTPFSDRYIPNRNSALWETRFSLLSREKSISGKTAKSRESNCSNDQSKDGETYTNLLKNEIFDTYIDDVTHLCDVSSEVNSVTSVGWNERGNLVAVGTNNGYIEIWDVATTKQISKLTGHTARVGSLAWSGDMLSSGSRDRLILQRDIRTPAVAPERRLPGHRQEVCGLKWSPDNQYLASGGNDNRLCVWNMHSTSPCQVYTDHQAAVKAIAWSPHHQGLLASGGGTADRTIKFWNTLIGQQVHCVDAGSQVCNLAWSKHYSELVSTHGYSQNQILVWKYPSLNQVTKLTGHTSRVLYLAMSPDGESIVTGAGDETLRFWNVFPKARTPKESKSVLNLFGNIR